VDPDEADEIVLCGKKALSAEAIRVGVAPMHKHILSIVSMGLLGGALLVGCGSSSTGGSSFSCEVKTAALHTCYEYDNIPAATATAEQSACTAEQGTAGTACPTANSLGHCSQTTAGVSSKEFYYSDVGGETAAMAQMACTAAAGSTWSM
jgi:hypothetical protein